MVDGCQEWLDIHLEEAGGWCLQNLRPKGLGSKSLSYTISWGTELRGFRLNLLERRDLDHQKRDQPHNRRDSSGREGINSSKVGFSPTKRRDQST